MYYNILLYNNIVSHNSLNNDHPMNIVYYMHKTTWIVFAHINFQDNLTIYTAWANNFKFIIIYYDVYYINNKSSSIQLLNIISNYFCLPIVSANVFSKKYSQAKQLNECLHIGQIYW